MDKQRQLDDFFGIPSPNNDDGEAPKPKHHQSIKEILDRKNRSFLSKLKLLPKVLSKPERYSILFFALVIVGSIIAIPVASYYHFTKSVPAYGGTLEEGIIGEPRHINPLISQNDADRDMVRLIYSGILKYNTEGKLVPDLAKSYDISADELSYTVYLKENAKWHDGEPVKADDVIFTVQTALNSDYGSFQKNNWQGIELEKADDYTIIFRLKNKYAQFLNNLTMPILPEHLWSNVKPMNFALSELNLKPIGSGPYAFKKLQKDSLGRITLYELSSNKDYYDGRPFIDKLRLKFYSSEDELVNSYNKNEVENLSLISAKNIKKLKFKQRLEIEKVSMPRYFAVFFNENQSKLLANKNIRLALAYGTNKQSLIDNILEGNGIAVNSPILSSLLGTPEEASNKYQYNKDSAVKALQDAGWTEKNELGLLIKKSQPASPKDKKNQPAPEEQNLSIKLTTSTWPELVEAANNLRGQWAELGIEIRIEILPTAELQQAIKERNYEMLLFGEILNPDPDPFTLWHSSQKRDPGRNLALYDNKNADTLLEDARKTLNPIERAAKYSDFQKLVIDELPALFLYSPYYLYGHSRDITGFDNAIIANPSERFLGISTWYRNTRRIWK